MKNSFYLSAAVVMMLGVADLASAASVIAPVPARAAMSFVQRVSVFCGAQGCHPITKVKRCAVNSNANTRQVQAQNGIRQQACNF